MAVAADIHRVADAVSPAAVADIALARLDLPAEAAATVRPGFRVAAAAILVDRASPAGAPTRAAVDTHTVVVDTRTAAATMGAEVIMAADCI